MHKETLSRKVRIIAPYSITHRFKVKPEFDGKSILELMSTRFPFKASAVWEKKIESGNIGVNGKEVPHDKLLDLGDEVYHHNPNVVEPSVPDEVEILEQTEDYLIVYKPAPLPMHPGGRYNKNSLTYILEEMGFEGLRIVHRLDSVTSGLVLLAKNKVFARKAMICFSTAKVEKTYFAEVAGNPPEEQITINAPIRRKTGFVFESELGLTKSKEAVTEFEVVERREQSCIIKCRPKTGRTHQIRLHLEKWGYPIIDDPIYGPDGDRSSKRAQNVAIWLINAGLVIEELGVKYFLDFEYSGALTEPEV
ncbi:MAG: RluA family pseudouridine synthase [Balneolaceae bacterium]